MVELGWIKTFLFLILGLQFTAVTGQYLIYITVRDGDEATLSCKNVMTDQDKCNSTSWLFSGATKKETAQLVELGQISENAKAESDRLSVTANCSLVIKNVTVEDAGHYFCQQYDRSEQQQGRDFVVYLFVVSMTEHKDADKVKLSCSVSTYGRCIHTVQWVYEGNDQDVKTELMKQSQSSCSATVEFTTSHLTETSKYSELFKCRVTNEISGDVQQFTFIPPSSDEGTKRAATTTSIPIMKSTTMGKSTMEQDFPDWAKFTIVAVGLASLLIIVLVLIRCKKTKRNKTQMDENSDPEDGVSYAYVTFTKNTNSKARVRGGDAAVIYSTVKASSSSAGASTDPSNIYATVNKPKK